MAGWGVSFRHHFRALLLAATLKHITHPDRAHKRSGVEDRSHIKVDGRDEVTLDCDLQPQAGAVCPEKGLNSQTTTQLYSCQRAFTPCFLVQT